jgi:branched-chain amino acid transport system ATP-binding protein
LLEIDNINVSYGDVQALWNISLKIDDGELIAIVGSNGAGKSTILKAISGLLHPTSGNIAFLGENINKAQPHVIVEKGISHILEGRRTFPYMSVADNLELGAYISRAFKKKAESFERVYELFPILKERKAQMAGTLSGGEQQILAIARGLMSQPKLLMLDEPSLGLAPKLVQTTFETISKINDAGVAILLVEQNTRHALAIAKRAYVLETGRMTLQGEGKDLLANEHVRKAYLGL